MLVMLLLKSLNDVSPLFGVSDLGLFIFSVRHFRSRSLA